MDQYRIKAYAKINLGLDVLKKLPNGFHQVKMIMQTIGLCDELTFERAESGIRLTSDAQGLSTGEDNLICKAARLMLETFHLREGVRIHLKKRIPIAAGMAGGSTDAAAAMKGICRLFDLDVPTEELMRLSVPVGADVPYCILGGTALAEGIGEKLTPLAPAPACHILTATPDISVSTRFVYEHLDLQKVSSHPDIDGMAEAIRQGSLQGILDRMGNVLESVTVPAFPRIAAIKTQMRELGAAGSLMSGSGPSVFGVFKDRETAQRAYTLMNADKKAGQLFLTEFM